MWVFICQRCETAKKDRSIILNALKVRRKFLDKGRIKPIKYILGKRTCFKIRILGVI
jgi:hypothetical protein